MSTETRTSIIVSELLENLELQIEKFENFSLNLQDKDVEVSEAMAEVAASLGSVFQNLLPVWRKDDEQWVPNITVTPAVVPKRTSSMAKVLQWSVWAIELREIALGAYEDNKDLSNAMLDLGLYEHNKGIRDAILDLADSYDNIGKVFESRLLSRKKKPFDHLKFIDRRPAASLMNKIFGTDLVAA